MAWLSYGLNEYGTPISCHTCDTCGKFFTVCPAHDDDPDDHAFDDCLGVECGSYDIRRDADRLFAQGKVKRR
jgi:hypothetical protein